MTGKSISFPGLEARDEDTDVSNHIKEMLKARSVFIESEYQRKIKDAEKRKVPNYMNELFKKLDKILFQEKDEKEWKIGVMQSQRKLNLFLMV